MIPNFELNPSALLFRYLQKADQKTGIPSFRISPFRICHSRCPESSLRADIIRSACSSPLMRSRPFRSLWFRRIGGLEGLEIETLLNGLRSLPCPLFLLACFLFQDSILRERERVPEGAVEILELVRAVAPG